MTDPQFVDVELPFDKSTLMKGAALGLGIFLGAATFRFLRDLDDRVQNLRIAHDTTRTYTDQLIARAGSEDLMKAKIRQEANARIPAQHGGSDDGAQPIYHSGVDRVILSNDDEESV